MGKTLDAIQFVHGLIMTLAFAMIVLAFSAPRPTNVYKDAEDELDHLQETLKKISKFRQTGYQAVYKDSEVRLSVLKWLSIHKSDQKDIAISTTDPVGISLPDPDIHPHITVEQEVRWVDKAYSYVYIPFIVCTAYRRDIFGALDKVFAHQSRPRIESIVVRIFPRRGGSPINGPWGCTLSARSARHYGEVHAVRTSDLAVPTRALEVTGVDAGPDWVDLAAGGWLKGAGYGDFEDTNIAYLPAVRELWPEIRTHDTSEVDDYLEQKEAEEREMSKQKITILGESLNGPLSMVFSSFITLFLLISFFALVTHARSMADGNEEPLRQFPLFGLLNSVTGKSVVVLTLFAFPFGATFLDLIVAFPAFRVQAPGLGYIVASPSRWIVTVAVGLFGLASLVAMFQTVAGLRRGASGE